MNKVLSSATAIIVGLFILFLIVFQPMTIVGVGERGVKVTLGKISPEVYGEGMHFITPLISKMHKLDVKTQKMNPATIVFTKDIQQARLSYVVNYNLIPEDSAKMYREVGKEYRDKIIVPTVEGTIKNVVGTWNAVELIGNREKATSDILLKLQSSLADNYINVTDFQITDIDYSDTFERAVEEKVTAEQEAQKAKNVTVKVEEEAKQTRLKAQAEADAIRLQAQALAQNSKLVELKMAEKWDGKLPQYMMGNSVPLLRMDLNK